MFLAMANEMNRVQGRIECIDENTAEEYKMEFDALHFVSNGSFYGLAEGFGYAHPSVIPDTLD
jgi:hypothetical protein